MKKTRAKRLLLLILIPCMLLAFSACMQWELPAQLAGGTSAANDYFSDAAARHSVELKTFAPPKPFDVSNLRGIGSISVKQALMIDGEENDLFCTFDDPDAALSDLKAAIPEYLAFLKETYHLAEISLKNLDVYVEKKYDYEQQLTDANDDEGPSAYKQGETLESFRHIYGLTAQNDAAIRTVFGSPAPSRTTTTAAGSKLAYLAALLPASDPLAEKLDSATRSALQAKYPDG